LWAGIFQLDKYHVHVRFQIYYPGQIAARVVFLVEDLSKYTLAIFHFLLRQDKTQPPTNSGSPLQSKQYEIDQLKLLLNSISDGLLIFNDFGQLIDFNYRASVLFDFHIDAESNIDFLEQKQLTDLLENHRRDWELVFSAKANQLEQYCICKSFKGKQFKVQISRHEITLQGTHCFVYALAEEQLPVDHYQRELEQILYKTVHNLKGPAASIQGLLQVAKQQVQDERALIYLNLLEDRTQFLERTLQELLNLSKIKNNHLQIDAISLEDLVFEIMDELAYVPGADEVQFKTGFNQSLPFYSDRNLLHSILINLIENAIKYRTTRRQSRVNISGDISQNMLTLMITDNGIGIKPELRERVFDMFYRASENATGTGLGLYMVKKGVIRLGGKVKILTGEQGGTEFHLTIPNKHRAIS